MKIVSAILPMDEELADANWIDYVVVRYEESNHKNVKRVIASVPLVNTEAEGRVTDDYVAALVEAFNEQEVHVTSVDVGGLVWPKFEDEIE